MTLIDTTLEMMRTRAQKATAGPQARFWRVYRSIYAPNTMPLFRVLDPDTSAFQDIPSHRLAAFDRSSQSILMYYGSVSANEWPLALQHELIHAMDENLYSDDVYSRQQSVMAGIARIQQTATSNDPRRLSSADRDTLTRWMMAKLGLGIIAEYRAWLMSLILYQEGLRTSVSTRIPFLDKVLNELCLAHANQPQYDMAQQVYLYLDRRFVSPKKPPFDTELVQNAMRLVRSELRSFARPIALGDRLEPILASAPKEILTCPEQANAPAPPKHNLQN